MRKPASPSCLLQRGLGVAQDLERARHLYEQAAAAAGGSAYAMRNLGYLYQHGVGVTPDAETAIRWYRAAAERGDTTAEAALRTLDGARSQPASLRVSSGASPRSRAPPRAVAPIRPRR